MIQAIVGAGGKTTLVKKLTRKYLAQGKKVFVTTSTHMFAEEDTLVTGEADVILRELEEKGYVMAGLPEVCETNGAHEANGAHGTNGVRGEYELREHRKIRALPMETYQKVCEKADVVLIEADGSKHMPLKFPSDREPVIYDNVEEILVVCGLQALGCRAKDVIHRLALAAERISISEEETVTPKLVQALVRKGYLENLSARYPGKKITVCPNHDGSLYQRTVAACLKENVDVSLLREHGDGALPTGNNGFPALSPAGDIEIPVPLPGEERPKVGCIIMASGISVRFGSNKLLAKFHGRTLIERVLETTDSPVFAKRVILTRTKEVAGLCRQKNLSVILHDCPTRNEAIQLGMEAMKDMDGCLFCPCDQPLLKKISVLNLVFAFWGNGSGIYRLAYRDRIGTPMLFAREFFEELSDLPAKRGGSHVAEMHPEKVRLIEAVAEEELTDVDQPKELAELEAHS